jgi:branched-chain amino acid transport system substrate-binding protein
MTKLESGSIVGASEVNASKLYLEDAGLQNIEIIAIDDGWEPRKTKSAFREVVRQGIRILVTSHVSTCAIAIEEDINRAKVLTFVTGATTDLLSGKDDYIFRTVQDVANEQKSIADYVNKQPADGIIVIRDTVNDAYTTPALKHFKANVKKPLVALIDIDIGKFDPNGIARSLPASGKNIVYLLIGGYKIAAGTIAQIVHQVMPTAKIVFTPWVKTPMLLETLGSAVSTSVIPSHYPPRGGVRAVDGYVARFKEKFGYPPTFISLNVYEALEIIGDAINEGHRDPDDIRRYMLKKKKFKTRFGFIVFDSFGDISRPLYFIPDLTREF